MRDVFVTLILVTPALGSVRGGAGDQVDRFLRGASSKPILRRSAWMGILAEGADMVRGRAAELVPEISVHPDLEGEVVRYRRYYMGKKYKDHEAFEAGSRITVTMRVPDEMTNAMLHKVLEAAGPCRGISQYRWKEWGLFTVARIEDKHASES